MGARVTLYQLILTELGEANLYFTKGHSGMQAVVFDGITYAPWGITADGFKTTGIGRLPTPTLMVSDKNNLLTPLILNNNDLLGALIKRIRTFDKFLDGRPDADPQAVLPIDTYIISRKIYHDTAEKVVQWQLKTLTDQEGSRLPADQMVRDYCSLTYRRFNSETGMLELDTSTNACPYDGPNHFDEQDVPTNAQGDRCGKRLGSCQLRFGETEELYFKGEPALARLKVR